MLGISCRLLYSRELLLRTFVLREDLGLALQANQEVVQRRQLLVAERFQQLLLPLEGGREDALVERAPSRRQQDLEATCIVRIRTCGGKAFVDQRSGSTADPAFVGVECRGERVDAGRRLYRQGREQPPFGEGYAEALRVEPKRTLAQRIGQDQQPVAEKA